MRQLSLFLLFLFFLVNNARAERFSVTAHGKGADRTWLIRHAGTDSIAPQRIVVFLHGYGANNPGCYGDWIAHLLGPKGVGEDRLVLFPKYQFGLWPPRGEKYAQRVQQSLGTVLTELKERHPTMTTEVTLIGHSMGSVIAANLADRHRPDWPYQIKSLLLTSPGHNIFPCGRQESYARIPTTMPTVLVTAEDDSASGEKFAQHFDARTPQLRRKIYLRQLATEINGRTVTAKHRTAVNPLQALYQPGANLITLGAKVLCRTDAADTVVYFGLSDLLLEIAPGSIMREAELLVAESGGLLEVER